jgi:hypothetical protein
VYAFTQFGSLRFHCSLKAAIKRRTGQIEHDPIKTGEGRIKAVSKQYGSALLLP